MVKATTNGRMVHSMTESGRKTIGMVKASSCGQTVLSKKESFKMTASKAMADSCGRKANISTKGPGSKI